MSPTSLPPDMAAELSEAGKVRYDDELTIEQKIARLEEMLAPNEDGAEDPEVQSYLRSLHLERMAAEAAEGAGPPEDIVDEDATHFGEADLEP